MQLSIPVNAIKGANSGFSTKGGTLTSPLVLAGDPVQPLEAATKQYVDKAIISIAASSLTTGTLSTQYFPQFTGDVSKGVGGTDIMLSATGVSAGTYSKTNVDSRGRVTAAYALASDDVPSFSWNKITTNVPVNLAGYGITNALNKAGDSLTGYLLLNNAPAQSLHAANKAYVDGVFANSVKLLAGDVVVKMAVSSPTGFLRANGSYVSKTVYSTLYSAIGDTFTPVSTQQGNGKPWRNQYRFNLTQNADITPWSVSGNLPTPTNAAQAIVTRTRVYLLGGSYSGATSNVWTAIINADGTLGAWASDVSLPAPVASAQAILTVNRVYLIGGVGSAGSDLNTTYTAPINPDGTLGAWAAGPLLPTGLSYSSAVITNSRVFLLGGRINNNTQTNSIYTCPINADGTLGAWGVSSQVLPAVNAFGQLVVTRARIYLINGVSASVFTTAVNADGTLTGWTTSTPLPMQLSYSQMVVTRNTVYVFGGNNGSGSPVSNVFYATVNADGTLGTWTAGTALYASLRDSQVITTSSQIYLLGGVDSVNNVSSTIYTAAFTGGLSDYTAYYNGSLTTVDPTTFRLPDYSLKEANGLNYFVKY